jgi:hypothetical protein
MVKAITDPKEKERYYKGLVANRYGFNINNLKFHPHKRFSYIMYVVDTATDRAVMVILGNNNIAEFEEVNIDHVPKLIL